VEMLVSQNFNAPWAMEWIAKKEESLDSRNMSAIGHDM
jgi:hypothetical protein